MKMGSSYFGVCIRRARRLITYSLVGAVGAISDFGLFNLLQYFGLAYVLANVVGYALGTLISFAINRKVTFGVMDRPLPRLISYFSVAALGVMVSTVLLSLLVGELAVNPVLAKMMTLPIVLILQFTLNTVITFRLPWKFRNDQSE